MKYTIRKILIEEEFLANFGPAPRWMVSPAKAKSEVAKNKKSEAMQHIKEKKVEQLRFQYITDPGFRILRSPAQQEIQGQFKHQLVRPAMVAKALKRRL